MTSISSAVTLASQHWRIDLDEISSSSMPLQLHRDQVQEDTSAGNDLTVFLHSEFAHVSPHSILSRVHLFPPQLTLPVPLQLLQHPCHSLQFRKKTVQAVDQAFLRTAVVKQVTLELNWMMQMRKTIGPVDVLLPLLFLERVTNSKINDDDSV